MVSKLVRPNFLLAFVLCLNLFIAILAPDFVSGRQAQAAGITQTNWKFDSLNAFYRTPFGAQPVGASVNLHFQTDAGSATAITVRLYDWKNSTQFFGTMTKVATDNGIDYWSYTVNSPAQPDIIYYRFIVTGSDNNTYYYEEQTAGQSGVGTIYTTSPDYSWQITYYDPNFTTPDWLKNAIIYQIFPDRFVNGDTTNDNKGMAKLETTAVTTHTNWTDYPNEPGQSSDFFGGDLKGIDQKVTSGYFTNLGINTLYLNPIFLSPSNHKYDTADYLAIDPRFGTMADFDKLVSDAHAKNLHIILDGVFNHTGDDSYYFNKYGHFNTAQPLDPNNPLGVYTSTDNTYTGSGQGAYQDQNSPYYWWYHWFNWSTHSYDCWAGYCSLPKLYPDQSVSQQPPSIVPNEATYIITDVARYYVNSHNTDGWRLDVANEINDEDNGDTQGNSPENHAFLAQFRSGVKSANPNAAIISEVWFNTSKWFLGDQMDSTMDYLFRDAIDGFLANGTDHDNPTNGQRTTYNASSFNVLLLSMEENYPPQVFYDLMNLVDSHDRPRVRWNLGDCDRTQAAVNPDGNSGWASDYNANCTYTGTNIPPSSSQESTITQRNELIALMQYAYPGAPTVYYGDEVGMTGFRDPDDRRTYPTTLTTTTQTTLLNYYSALGSMRTNNASTLITGSLTTLYINNTTGGYAFGRKTTDNSKAAVVILNNQNSAATLTIPVNSSASGSYANFLPNGATLSDISPSNAGSFTVSNGVITVNAQPYQGFVLQTTSTITPPNAPSSLSVTSNYATLVQLSWSAPSSGPTPTSYNVYRSYFKGGGYNYLGTASGTSYTDSTAHAGVPYYYVVKAVVNGEENPSATAFSNEVGVSPHATPTVNGAIGTNEYGNQVDGYNQQTNGSQIWYATWDNTNLYIGISGATTSEAAVIYIDKDPTNPINSGTGSGSFSGYNNYDGTDIANLPFQADFVTYFKNGYREYRTNSGSGWSSATTAFGSYSDNGSNVREIAIPWSAITGGSRPSSFAWFGYLTSSTGYAYGTVPTSNPTGSIGTSATYPYYYIVNDTSNSAAATYPFAHPSFDFVGGANITSSQTIWDLTVNKSGSTLTDNSALTVNDNLLVNAGTLDLSSESGAATVKGNVTVASGSTLKLSNNSGSDLYIGGNFTNNGTFTTNSRAVFFNGTSANQTITSNTAFDYLILSAGANVNSAATLTINHQVINNGGNFLPSGTVNYASSATITSSGYINASGSNLFAGSNAVSGSGNTYFNNATLSGGVDFGSHSTVNGTLQLNAGGYVNNNAPFYGKSSQLLYNTGGTYGVFKEWTAGAYGEQGVPQNVVLSNNTTLNLGNQAGNHAVTGNITINAGSNLQASSGYSLVVGGNFTNSGTFTPNNDTVVFNGGANQNLTLNTSTNFNNLTVISPTVLIETVSADNAHVAGTVSNSGDIRKSQTISGTGSKTFGLTGAAVNVSSLTGLTSLQVDRYDTNAPNVPTNAQTGKYWTIATNAGGSGSVIVTLPIPSSVPSGSAMVASSPTGSSYTNSVSSINTTVTPNTVSSGSISLATKGFFAVS